MLMYSIEAYFAFISIGGIMKNSFLILSALVCSFQVLAQKPSASEEQFCANQKDVSFIKELALDPNNLSSMRNRGGIANAGVCWWHSRFQRNALYLTIYNPELPKPSPGEIQALVSEIRYADSVVTIPGYKNFFDFTAENKSIIQKELNSWQFDDGVFDFAWLDGLSGDPEVSSQKMKSIMNSIYYDVEINNNITYAKLQIPGIKSHAWSIVHMNKVKDGYSLEVIDSNTVGYTERYEYREGDESIVYHVDHADVTASTLKALMDQAYQINMVTRDFSRNIILPGFEFHGWGLVSIKKVTGGYDLDVIINDNGQLFKRIIYKYHDGDLAIDFSVVKEDYAMIAKENLKRANGFTFTPYLEKADELQKIKAVIAEQCSTDNSNNSTVKE